MRSSTLVLLAAALQAADADKQELLNRTGEKPSGYKVQAICDSVHSLDCFGNDLSTFGKVTTHMACCEACEAHAGCNAWTWDWKVTTNCFLKTACNDKRTDSDAYHSGFSNSPSPTPPSPPSPPAPPALAAPRGCGVAISGDWPNCGAQFDTSYNFDLTAMMKSAQDVAYYKLWRYDWRSTQHPYGGPWTYVHMDWCWRGGVNEHPNPADDSPGLMGWNEPNVQGQCDANNAADGSGITEFVNLATQYKARGKFVVSPAPGGDATWTDTFLGQLKGRGFFGVDYIAYHHYVTCDYGTTGDAMYGEMSGLLSSAINVMNKYNGQGFHIKGIWITEIACSPEGGWGARPYNWDSSKPPILMDKFVDIINNYPQLQAWNWFGYSGFGNLWNYGSWSLTDLGRTYFSNCHGDRAPISLSSTTNVTFDTLLPSEALGRPGHLKFPPQVDMAVNVVV